MKVRLKTLKIIVFTLIFFVLAVMVVVVSTNKPPQIVYKEIPVVKTEIVEKLPQQKIVNCGIYQDLVNKHNEIREDVNVPLLQCGDMVMQSALQKNAYLVEQGCFDHTCTPNKDTFYFHRLYNIYGDIGENLAQEWKNDEEMIQAFIKSPAHYENIINPLYKYIGISKLYRPDGSTVYTFHFSE